MGAPVRVPPLGSPPERPPQAATPRPGPGVSIQNLLLGLGAALITAAVLVFTAVNWSRLGATFQGLALLVVTSVAASGAAVTARRRMPVTAEALGLAAVMLAIADAHAIRFAFVTMEEPWGYWAAALAVISVGAWLFGAGTGIRSTRVVAAGIGQLPLVAVLAVGVAVPALVAWLRADRDGDRNLALGAATALALFDV